MGESGMSQNADWVEGEDHLALTESARNAQSLEYLGYAEYCSGSDIVELWIRSNP